MIKLRDIPKKSIGLMLCCMSFLVNAQDSLDIEKIEQQVDKYLTYFSGENPGAVVTVIKKGDIIFKKAYGYKNIESKQSMSGDELFHLGELSKSFTALAVLKLIEKNKLELSTTIKDIFPDFPDYGKNITIHHILDHKSGLANYNENELSSNDDVVDFLKKQDTSVFESGSEFKYSNSEYPLLVNIIEKTSNKTYKEFLKKYMFKKLSLNNTYFIDEIKDKNIAAAHFKDDDIYSVNNIELKEIYGEQGIWINAADYAKYDKALYQDKLLNCENLSKIFRVGKLTNKENVSDYTCGWALMAKGGVRYFWQGGMSNGYTNLVLHLPDTQTTVLILTNRNDGYDFLKLSIYIAKLFDKDLKL